MEKPATTAELALNRAPEEAVWNCRCALRRFVERGQQAQAAADEVIAAYERTKRAGEAD